jgi:cytoskeletal protein CcmA (bactofilin family)
VKEPKTGIRNILSKGVKINGKLKIEGSIHIDGELEGRIEVSELLIVGKTGKIQGEIYTKDCLISGRIEGNLYCTGKVEFKAGAILKGDLSCKQLIIEEGVIFDGNCKMSERRIEKKDTLQLTKKE